VYHDESNTQVQNVQGVQNKERTDGLRSVQRFNVESVAAPMREKSGSGGGTERHLTTTVTTLGGRDVTLVAVGAVDREHLRLLGYGGEGTATRASVEMGLEPRVTHQPKPPREHPALTRAVLPFHAEDLGLDARGNLGDGLHDILAEVPRVVGPTDFHQFRIVERDGELDLAALRVEQGEHEVELVGAIGDDALCHTAPPLTC